jgi:hypothetical protein
VGGRASKQKGYRREREVVLALGDAGLDAKRMPLSGALGGDLRGDVMVEGTRLEIKGRKEPPKVLEGWLDDNDALVLIADRRPWRVYLPFDSFVEYLQLKKQAKEVDSA